MEVLSIDNRIILLISIVMISFLYNLLILVLRGGLNHEKKHICLGFPNGI